MQEIVIENLPDVGANQRTLIKGQLTKYLWEKGKLRKVVFEFPSRKETRYLFGNITNFELAQALKPDAYLVHRAAMYLNNLCPDPPEIIHINVEQSQHHKRNTNSLSQGAIDQAFKNKARVSNEIAEANGMKVCVTHGQKTDRLGVKTKTGQQGEKLRVTDIERTLIDITVRPLYAGGPNEVLKAYAQAGNRVSIEKLVTTLSKMNFVYPFHQAVGFYLEASKAFAEEDLAKFERMERPFDFYIDYRMKQPVYSKHWKIFYPKDLMM